MSNRNPEGHPIVVMAAGGFLGGVVAGGSNAGFWAAALLTLVGSYIAVFALGHVEKEKWKLHLGTLLGLSTTIPLPAGLLGFFFGKVLWGTP